MKPLSMVVCVKVVPKPEEVSVNPETRTLDRAKARSEINPADMNAVEMALGLRERYGGTVSLISMGPPFAVPYLEVVLAMGADRAYLLSDRLFAGADTLATSLALARAIAKIGDCDLALCGEESSDGATGQVPAGLAQWLERPQITYAVELALLPNGRLCGKREILRGHEVLAVSLPAVASVKLDANEPRFMDVDYRRTQPEITIWSAADLEVDSAWLGFEGSPTVVASVWKAEASGRRREYLHGSPKEKVRLLAQRLRRLSRAKTRDRIYGIGQDIGPF